MSLLASLVNYYSFMTLWLNINHVPLGGLHHNRKRLLSPGVSLKIFVTYSSIKRIN